jgi:hypothetical protein
MNVQAHARSRSDFGRGAVIANLGGLIPAAWQLTGRGILLPIFDIKVFQQPQEPKHP